jgi:hypothetical protein
MILIPDQAVLHIDAQPIEAYVGHEFGRVGITNVQPGADRLPTFSPGLECLIYPHGEFSV